MLTMQPAPDGVISIFAVSPVGARVMALGALALLLML
jgi:hypothetical protein